MRDGGEREGARRILGRGGAAVQANRGKDEQNANSQRAYGSFMGFLAEYSSGTRRESWDCRASGRHCGWGWSSKFGEQHAAQFAGLAVVGAGVVNHLGLGAGAGDDHGVPRRRLAELAIEEQVAGQRRAHVAADEDTRCARPEFWRRQTGQRRRWSASAGSKAPGRTRKSAAPSGRVRVTARREFRRAAPATSIPVVRNQPSSWRLSASR